MKTPLTKEKLQHHLTYSMWKYVLLIVLAVFGWNIIYTVTRPQTPEDRKIVLGVVADGSMSGISAYMEELQQTFMPDMEEMAVNQLVPDEMYIDYILATRVAARDCDVYLMPRSQFQNYAAQGTFMPLEDVLPDLLAELEAAGVSLSRGFRAGNEDGTEKHQYAIPCADLPGLRSLLQGDVSDAFLCIFVDTGNDENVIKFFDRFVRDMLQAPADTAPAA